MKLFTVTDTVHIDAPIDRCFLLSTSVDLVAQVLRMRPVTGKTSGLVELDDLILWRGWKFGLPQIHESHITAYDRPSYFQDTMVRGRFKYFHHDHHFTEVGGHTLLHDKVRFSSVGAPWKSGCQVCDGWLHSAPAASAP